MSNSLLQRKFPPDVGPGPIHIPLKIAEKPNVNDQERIKVLIADDDNQLSRRLASYIEDRRFPPRSSITAKTLVRPLWIGAHAYLADLMLPDGNALSLIDYIKSEYALRHSLMHVIVMSGHNVETNVRQSLQRGAKDYIVKPFRHEDLGQAPGISFALLQKAKGNLGQGFHSCRRSQLDAAPDGSGT